MLPPELPTKHLLHFLFWLPLTLLAILFSSSRITDAMGRSGGRSSRDEWFPRAKAVNTRSRIKALQPKVGCAFNGVAAGKYETDISDGQVGLP